MERSHAYLFTWSVKSTHTSSNLTAWECQINVMVKSPSQWCINVHGCLFLYTAYWISASEHIKHPHVCTCESLWLPHPSHPLCEQTVLRKHSLSLYPIIYPSLPVSGSRTHRTCCTAPMFMYRIDCWRCTDSERENERKRKGWQIKIQRTKRTIALFSHNFPSLFFS